MTEAGLVQLTAAEATQKIARGELSSEQYVQACRDRIAAADGEVHAFIHIDPAHALAQARQRLLETERRVGLGGDREPDVELVVAQIVVRYAGVLVDHVGGAPRVRGIDLGGHEHRAVAERASIEDRRDLADDALVEQVLDAGEYLVLADPGLACDVLVGPRRDREARPSSSWE